MRCLNISYYMLQIRKSEMMSCWSIRYLRIIISRRDVAWRRATRFSLRDVRSQSVITQILYPLLYLCDYIKLYWHECQCPPTSPRALSFFSNNIFGDIKKCNQKNIIIYINQTTDIVHKCICNELYTHWLHKNIYATFSFWILSYRNSNNDSLVHTCILRYEYNVVHVRAPDKNFSRV